MNPAAKIKSIHDALQEAIKQTTSQALKIDLLIIARRLKILYITIRKDTP